MAGCRQGGRGLGGRPRAVRRLEPALFAQDAPRHPAPASDAIHHPAADAKAGPSGEGESAVFIEGPGGIEEAFAAKAQEIIVGHGARAEAAREEPRVPLDLRKFVANARDDLRAIGPWGPRRGYFVEPSVERADEADRGTASGEYVIASSGPQQSRIAALERKCLAAPRCMLSR